MGARQLRGDDAAVGGYGTRTDVVGTRAAARRQREGPGREIAEVALVMPLGGTATVRLTALIDHEVPGASVAVEAAVRGRAVD